MLGRPGTPNAMQAHARVQLLSKCTRSGCADITASALLNPNRLQPKARKRTNKTFRMSEPGSLVQQANKRCLQVCQHALVAAADN